MGALNLSAVEEKKTIYRFKLQLCNLFASALWDTWRLLGLTILLMIFLLLLLIFFLMPKSLCSTPGSQKDERFILHQASKVMVNKESNIFFSLFH